MKNLINIETTNDLNFLNELIESCERQIADINQQLDNGASARAMLPIHLAVNGVKKRAIARKTELETPAPTPSTVEVAEPMRHRDYDGSYSVMWIINGKPLILRAVKNRLGWDIEGKVTQDVQSIFPNLETSIRYMHRKRLSDCINDVSTRLEMCKVSVC